MGVRTLCRPRFLGGAVAAAVATSSALVVLAVAAPVAGATTPTISTSTGFAGYAASLTNSSSTASNTIVSTFTAPALNCASTPSSASYMYEEAGLVGGLNTKTVLEAIGAVAEKCTSGTAAYAAAVLAGKKLGFLSAAPAAGDSIRITATESSAGSSVTLLDVTSGKSISESGTGAEAQLVAAGLAPTKGVVPTFTTVPFTASVNGANLSSSAKAFNLVNGKTTLVSTGALSGTPSAWTETFAANS
jgi:hypothetical protein